MLDKWYKESFGLEYLALYRHRDRKEAKEAIDFIEREIGISTGDLIFDLCCGAGRHSLEFRLRGYRVVGLDLSKDLLNEARRRAEKEHTRLPLVRGEMAAIPFYGCFDLVVNFFNSFGYYLQEEQNLAVLQGVYASLKKGGRFLIDYFNKPSVVAHLEPESRRVLDNDAVLVERRTLDRKTNRVNKKTTLIRGSEKSERVESVRLYSPEELRDLLEDTGFRISRIFGAFDGGPYVESSKHLIVLAIKE